MLSFWSARPQRHHWQAGRLRRLVVSQLVMERLAVLAWCARPRRT